MYTENINAAMGLFDEIFDELARIARTKMDGKGNGCTCVTIDPLDNKSQIAKLVESRPVGYAKKVVGLKFKDILDDIDQVIFNEPATIVTFKDGSKVCVKASEHDTFCKEIGLVYAIIKRLYANDVDENGYLRSKGLGDRINQIVENGFDQKKQERERRAKLKAKAERKAKAKLADEVSEQAAKEAVE